jgi:hypothetical protein
MEAIAHWVEHLGGGLLMTGGRRSFGAGGWYKSAVERVLPVTMELRDEHRKLSLALAVCLDRSGSMAATVAGGGTKMDLANAGTAAAIELLSANDEVSVFAIDSAPHEVIPRQAVDDPQALVRRVRQIESMGGGIYCYEALVAGGQALLASDRATRHLILFADAADAEQPGDYQQLLADYRAAGITVSVIGLGNASDSDAALLEDIAHRGGGRCVFATDADDLPRLFAQETVIVARSTWVDQAVTPLPTPLIHTVLGQPAAAAATWPAVSGYNLVYPRQRAQVLAQAPGDPSGPALACWRIGAGRSAALSVDVDGAASGDLLAWDGYAALLAGIVRWCAGNDDDGIGAISVDRHGDRLDLHLTLDPSQRADWPLTPPQITLLGHGQQPQQITMQRNGDGHYQARGRLHTTQPLVPTVVIAEHALIGPAIQLPYSPELAPQPPERQGDQVLADLSHIGGGTVREDLLGAYDNPASPGQRRDLSPYLIALAVLLLVLEIASRRWRWHWNPRWLRRRPRPARAEAPPTRPTAQPSAQPSAQHASPTDASHSTTANGTQPGSDPAKAGAADDDLSAALARLRQRH